MQTVQLDEVVQQMSTPLDDSSITGRWSDEENIRFLLAVCKVGTDWEKVKNIVETRTSSQVRSHAQKFFIKLKKINQDRRKSKASSSPKPMSPFQAKIMETLSEKLITAQTPKQISELLERPRKNPIVRRLQETEGSESFFTTVMRRASFQFERGMSFSDLIDIPTRERQDSQIICVQREESSPWASSSPFRDYGQTKQRKMSYDTL